MPAQLPEVLQAAGNKKGVGQCHPRFAHRGQAGYRKHKKGKVDYPPCRSPTLRYPILAAPPVQWLRRLLPVFSLLFGQCVLLPATQEFNQLSPRMEAKRLPGIHLFNTAFELFLALFSWAPKAYYESSLHDQVQLTAGL